jgi:hypothetical protein
MNNRLNFLQAIEIGEIDRYLDAPDNGDLAGCEISVN